jgi:ADP-dependent phosphofructokinase/glucokinase
MQLQISVNDDKAELFLQILKEFKSDMVEKYHIIKSNYKDDNEQNEIEEMLNSRTKEDKEIAFSKIVKIDLND